jgi:hypothetical protein
VELGDLAVEVGYALVSLVDTHRQWFKSRVGMDASELLGDAEQPAEEVPADEVHLQRQDAKQQIAIGGGVHSGGPAVRRSNGLRTP